VASILILTNPGISAWVHCANFFVFAAILTTGVALMSGVPLPETAIIWDVAWWLLPVGLLIALPVGFATVYGATILNPGVVGLLFMGEVAVAAISAAILTNEPFGMREVIGVVLVMTAGLLEPLREISRNRRKAT
jgi:drug/metabolite transporter (DMT)-like permease